MLTGQAAGPASPTGSEACGTRHLNVDRTLEQKADDPLIKMIRKEH